MEARYRIRVFCRYWCQELAARYRVTAPADETIVATTRGLARYESVQAAAHRLGSAILSQPHWDSSLQRMLDPDPATSAALKASEHRHTEAAAVARADAMTGRDLIEARAGHLARHLERILADPDLVLPFLLDLGRTIAAVNEHRPRPRPTSVTVTCGCGQRLRARQEMSVQCPACGTVAGITETDPMTLPDLVDWLTGYGIPVTHRQLREWADDGVITPTGDPADRGRGKPRRFDPAAVLIVARRRIGASA